MTPRSYRTAWFVFAGLWAVLSVGALAKGDLVQAGLNFALSVIWLLVALFRDPSPPGPDSLVERQRARLKGFGAITFRADSDPRPEDE